MLRLRQSRQVRDAKCPTMAKVRSELLRYWNRLIDEIGLSSVFELAEWVVEREVGDGLNRPEFFLVSLP